MQSYTVTQKLLNIGATYQVQSSETNDVVMTVKGKLLSFTPKLEARAGDAKDGPVSGKMKGNFFKTKFSIMDAEEKAIGSITFPLIAFTKNFTLTMGEKSYKTKGGFISNTMTAKDEGGKDVLAVSKQIGFKDRFTVLLDEGLPRELGILAAVAVDQKFFEG